jgi:hypothetical protein
MEAMEAVTVVGWLSLGATGWRRAVGSCGGGRVSIAAAFPYRRA